MRSIPHLTKHSAFLLGCLVLLSLGAYGLDRHLVISQGLKGSYYPNPNWRGEPLWVTLDSEISTDLLRMRRKKFPENRFSVLWTGFIIIEKTGEYAFTIASDDGSSLSINNQLVVDNGGTHGLETATGHIYLEAGVYPIQLKYFQAGGSYGLALSWAQGNQPLKRLPSSILSPQPVNYGNYKLRQRLNTVGFLLKLVWAGVLGYLIFSSDRWLKLFKSLGIKVRRFYARTHPDYPPYYPIPLRQGLFAMVFFLFLTVFHTWPLVANPARWSRNNNLDTVHITWTLCWIAHSLTRDPLHLFHANIFYPEPYALAFSDPFLVPGLLAVPLREFGASPVLTYNVLLLLGFFLTALAMYGLVVRFTGDHLAGLLGGSLLAFNAHTLTRLPHLQAHYAFWLPWALLTLDRLILHRRLKDSIQLGCLVALLCLTSGYLGVFAIFAVGIGLMIRIDEWWGSSIAPVLSRMGLATLITAVIVLPLLAPYWVVHRSPEMIRPLDAVTSASLTSYVAAVGRLHYAIWSHRLSSLQETLFPGILAVGLSVIKLVNGRCALRNGRVRMFIGIGIMGFLLSFGPATPVYTWLYQFFPPLWGIRATSRFGYLFLLALAALASYGLIRLRRRFAGRRWITFLAFGLVIAVNIEALRAPMNYVSFEGIPEIYQYIARDPGPAVVAEIPFYPISQAADNAPYMLASTLHWKPLVNGYSSFFPSSYRRYSKILPDFPSEAAIEELQRIGVTYVVVHPTRYYDPSKAEAVLATLAHRPEFIQVATGSDGTVLYRLHPPGNP
ncbi:MAG TPA: PA14 domain-containing protein [Candidatus Limnocylindrales bacterium]|nr:PA14 domain-containing protein [Candidatus Limnocylindrales bacterium]